MFDLNFVKKRFPLQGVYVDWWALLVCAAFAFPCPATDKQERESELGRGQRTESEARRERSHRTGAKMLAVFDPTVAKCPEGLRGPPVAGATAAAAGGVGALMKGFSAAHDGAVTVSLGPSGALAYSAANQSPLVPRCCAHPARARVLAEVCACEL